VEILVAMAVLAVLVILLGGIVRQVSGAWVSGEARTRNRESGRTVADFIARELQGALLPIDPGTPGLQWVLNPASVPASVKNPDALFWQAPLATRRAYGDLAEIGYFVRWDMATPDRPRAKLCRFFVNPAIPDPDQPGESLPNPQFRIHDQPEGWLSETILDEAAPADRANDFRGLFAENVLGLWVRCFDPRGEVISGSESGGTFDSRAGYTIKGTKEDRPLPAMVEIGFVVADPRSADLIDTAMQALIVAQVRQAGTAAAFLQWASGDDRMRALRPGLRAHTKTVNLLNAR